MHVKTIICAIISAKRIIIETIQRGNHKIMSTLEDIQAAQAVTAKIAGFPAPGLTPEQQAAIDDIAAHASKINDSLAAVDASANPAPAA
jgi:hypothetical protein